MIAEVISASEPNPGNVYPYVGEGCENLGRKLSDVMKSKCQKKLLFFLFVYRIIFKLWLNWVIWLMVLFDVPDIQQRDLKNKAVAMIKPDWLKMLVSANLLGITPSISAVVRDKA